MEMQNYQLMQIPEYRIAHHPMKKLINKIRVTTNLFSNSTPKDHAKSSARFDGDETTARSFSTASKMYEIKSSLRKPFATEESAAEGLNSMASQKPLLDSRRSFISNPSHRLLSEGNYSSDTRVHLTASSGKITDKNKKAKKPGLVFNSEFKPEVVTTTDCSLCLTSLETQRQGGLQKRRRGHRPVPRKVHEAEISG